jgi:hypothetical protein
MAFYGAALQPIVLHLDDEQVSYPKHFTHEIHCLRLIESLHAIFDTVKTNSSCISTTSFSGRGASFKNKAN